MEEKKEAMAKTIKWPIYPLYGLDGVGFGATSALGSYIKFVLTDVMFLSLAQVTLFDLVSPILNAILALFYGVIASKISNGKSGRYFKILVGCGVLYCVLHFIRHWDVLAQALGNAYWLVGALLMSFSVLVIGVSGVAINAMMPIIGKNSTDTVTMAKTRGIFMTVAQLIFAALIPVWMVNWADKGNGYVFAVAAAITGIIYLVFNVAQAFLIKKYQPMDAEEPVKTEVAPKKKVKTSELFKSLIQSPQTLVVMGWIFAQWLTYLYLVTIASYYFIYVAENTILLSPFFTIGNFCALGGTFISSFVTKKLGLRTTGIICSSVQVACGFLSYFFAQVNPIIVMVLCGLLTLAHGVMGPTATGMMGDCCVVAENKLHKDQTTFIMGFVGSPASWAPYVYNLVANGILAWAGYSASAAITPEFKTKMAVLLLPVGIFALIGWILVTFLYKGTTERIAKMREENAAYRAEHPEEFQIAEA